MATVETAPAASGTEAGRAGAAAAPGPGPGGDEPLAHFDRVARLYRAMELASFGPMLERCRFGWIAELTERRRALVLGDGDGRFVAKLLEAAPGLRADAVDGSPAMLHLLRKRVAVGKNEARLTTVCMDVRSFVPPGCDYDLVATHFFLDCLTEAETEALIARVRPHLTRGARWVVSEFEVLDGDGVGRWVSRGIIAGLYAAFRVLTGLRVRKIPPWRALLERHGLVCAGSRRWLGGLLTSELWEAGEATGAG